MRPFGTASRRFGIIGCMNEPAGTFLTVSATGPMADAFSIRYSSKCFDAETGLYCYGRRFYSPVLRRWITRDPIGEEGGVNLYAFCGNNATQYFDATGEKIIIQVDPNPSRKAIITLKNGRHPRAITVHRGNCKFSCSKDCKIIVTGHITLWIEMLDSGNSRWNKRYPQYVGNGNITEEENTYRHEMDHYKTWTAFYNFLISANSYEGRYYRNCNEKARDLNARYQSMKTATSQHSQSFDTPLWSQGGRYEEHILDTSNFKWED